MRVLAFVGIVAIAIVGALFIILIPALEPAAQVENTYTRLTVFLGPILTFLIGFVTVNRQVDSVSGQVNDVQDKVNGHLQRITTALVAATADHPDVATKALEAGVTLPTTDTVQSQTEGTVQ